MTLRFAVMADSQRECAEGLALLRELGVDVTLLPAQLCGDRWIARAVPTPTAPASEGQGRG
ncbi:hypothetical protein OTB20_19410 [Streptomyces sp. H27-H1]|uniref:hypothetical protein n=1 Tax=Streptomyces sp. H27-H1 TaxID=2996461 RepID=UPI00227163FA|nr:hypothetical protein [Streptomyces sp. H27-H1]MCY0928325.1 hypothetical protein [Streptomyces sp. H27-H1]